MIISILAGLLQLLAQILSLYGLAVLASALLSWVSPDPYNPVVKFLSQITEPALRPIRKQLWPVAKRFGFDLSPLVLLILLQVVEIVIRSVIVNLRY